MKMNYSKEKTFPFYQNVQTDCAPSRLTAVTLHPGYDFDDIWSPSTVSQVLTPLIWDLELCFY